MIDRNLPYRFLRGQPLKTDLANLRFLSFEKGEACQSINQSMLRGKISLSKPEVKKIGCV